MASVPTPHPHAPHGGVSLDLSNPKAHAELHPHVEPIPWKGIVGVVPPIDRETSWQPKAATATRTPTATATATATPSAAPTSLPPAEVTLLQNAQDALPTTPALALADCDDDARRYPNGLLAQEREVLAIDALVRLGRHDDATARAARFSAAYPSSTHLRRIDVILGRKP